MMECDQIPEVNYGEFSRRFHDKVEAQRVPINGSFELTYRCNFRCSQCYSVNVPHEPAQKELTADHICRILDEVAQDGCLWMCFTGGESLLRPDFPEIYIHAKEKGFIIILFTNASLITPEIADLLKEYRPFSVDISIYGNTAETYEAVTNTPDSFEKSRRGIYLLQERNIPFKLKTMVMTLNKHELWDMKRFAEGLGVKFRYDPILMPELNGSKRPCQYRLSPAEVVEFDLMDNDRLKEWKELWERNKDVPRSDRLYLCGAALSSFTINPYGQLQLCPISRHPSLDLTKHPFREGWYDLFPKVRALKPKGEYKCARCELLAICGHCPGWGELENGDQEAPVEYLCQIAHLRAERFGLFTDEESKPKIRKEVILR